MTSTFLFLMMIMMGPSEAIDKIPKDYLISIKLEMRQFAKEQQIMDMKIVYEYEDWDFHNELHGYWENFQELKDVPRLEDFNNRFGIIDNSQILQGGTVISKALVFNTNFRKFIENKKNWEIDRVDFYTTILQENEACRQDWYKIDTINETFYAGDAMKRRAYRDLKKKISKEDWENPHYFPPETPVWRFYEKKLER